MLLLLSVITREFALMSVTYFGASVLGEDVLYFVCVVGRRAWLRMPRVVMKVRVWSVLGLRMAL